MTPKSSKHINIDSILVQTFLEGIADGGTGGAMEDVVKEAEQRLYDLMLEIIDSTINDYEYDDPDYQITPHILQLEVDLHERLTDLFGKGK